MYYQRITAIAQALGTTLVNVTGNVFVHNAYKTAGILIFALQQHVQRIDTGALQ